MKTSIIIANRNDLEMLSVTVRSSIEELVMMPDADIIICDNSDQEIYNLLDTMIPSLYCKRGKVKIIRQDFPCLFTAREAAIRESNAEYIICLDSHMLSGHNTFLDLVNFMDKNIDNPKIGFAHAPICWIHQHECHSKHDRDLTESELGPWGVMREAEQKITWKGIPWICRRDWFLNELKGYGSLSRYHISWGGGDMHIGTKAWLLGYENWAVPCRPCVHIGPFPKTKMDSIKKHSGYQYRLYSDSGNGPHTFGFMVACYVLGGEEMMKRNAPFLKERFGLNVEECWNEAIEYGADEREWLLSNQKISYENYLNLWKNKQ